MGGASNTEQRERILRDVVSTLRNTPSGTNIAHPGSIPGLGRMTSGSGLREPNRTIWPPARLDTFGDGSGLVNHFLV
ncbi:hypothetical protein SKAU_G00390650 [Synaphobranchus kaupii]|uniref:Uncharacterized protein n=1 Tax=Synaphobranchus kaupii TaxID=118154 RepID=A0A9Q1EBD1_SYNKA|nr:hypothetical protein SKAU_G00390650 [Synaphobranchus kaupii]